MKTTSTRRLRLCLIAALAAVPVILGIAGSAGALPPSPALLVWGKNTNAQLSYLAPAFDVVPTPVVGNPSGKCTKANLDQATAVAGGGEHSLALIKQASGVVCTWGHNFYGQLARHTLGPPTNVPFPACQPTTPVSATCQTNVNAILNGVTAIGGGGFHSIALLAASNNMGLPAGAVVTWGQNNNGELGRGSTVNASAPVAVCIAACTATGPFLTGAIAVSAGIYWNIALLGSPNSMGLPGGSVVAWGDNTYGQLGLGNNTAAPSTNTCIAGPSNGSWCSMYPKPVQGIDKLCGGTVGSTGSLVPGPLTGVTAISAGGVGALALMRSGNVCSWGDNAYGQLGIKNDGTVPSSPNGCFNNFLSTTRSCGWDARVVLAPTNAQDCPSAGSPYLSGVTAIAAGNFHHLALVSNNPGGGTVCAFGNNANGQLGIGASSPDSCSGATACSDEPIAVWGVGGLGLLGGVTAITAGGSGGGFSLALVNPPYSTGGASGQAVAWGANGNGQLGIGTTTPASTPSLVCASAAITVGPAPCPGGPYLTGVAAFDASINTHSLAVTK